MSDYLRLLMRIKDTPLLISESKLDIITNNVTIPLLLNQPVNTEASKTAREKSTLITASPQVGIIEIFDGLVARNGIGNSGITSYDFIKSQILSLVEQKVNIIGFHIDSPGGESAVLFSLTDFISSLPTLYGIKTFSYIDGQASSAAYAIASATQKIYSYETALAGSIGAVMTLAEVTKRDEKDGVSYTIIRSAPKKHLGNPHEVFSELVLNKATAMVTAIADIFNSKVVAYRPNLTLESIIATEGDVFMAKEAIKLGLVDSLATSLEEVISLEVASLKSPETVKKIGTAMTLEEAQAKIKALETELGTVKAETTNMVAKAISDERSRVNEILSAGTTLKISSEQILKRINAGSSKEDSLDVFTAIAEAVGTKTSIDTASNQEGITSEANTPKATTSVVIGETSVNLSSIMSEAKKLAKQ